jgi:type II secretory pathway component PulF
MPRFAYSARDSAGRTATDEVTAPSRRDALRLLKARGLQPLQLDELGANGRPFAPKAASKGSPRSLVTGQAGGFSRRNFLPFLQALAELVASGLSAGEAVRLLALRLKDRQLRGLSAAIWERLSEGQPLSQAMEQIPRVFDRQTVSLVRAAEATGSLNEVLHRLITHHTEQRELRQKLVTAMIYPVFVCVVAFGVILFFVMFLMPRLQTLLTSLGSKLPFATQLLVGSAQVLLRYGIVLLPLVVFGALFLWRWRHTERGHTTTDAWLVQLPGVRRLAIDSALLNFTQTLAVLLENGINPAEALRLTERTVGNRTVQAALRAATDRVLEGENLSIALGRSGYFPDLVLDRLAVGESTGKLAPCLRDIARNYATEHSRRLHALTTVMSSAVLLFAFAFVGFIAYAIVSAVLQVSASFRF